MKPCGSRSRSVFCIHLAPCAPDAITRRSYSILDLSSICTKSTPTFDTLPCLREILCSLNSAATAALALLLVKEPRRFVSGVITVISPLLPILSLSAKASSDPAAPPPTTTTLTFLFGPNDVRISSIRPRRSRIGLVNTILAPSFMAASVPFRVLVSEPTSNEIKSYDSVLVPSISISFCAALTSVTLPVMNLHPEARHSASSSTLASSSGTPPATTDGTIPEYIADFESETSTSSNLLPSLTLSTELLARLCTTCWCE
mmetsp:Transcript_21301/g.87068  ORF Transcript_21301/g.87068 Transcript_21301/m.87068 type:complete len:259 (+) Transcript_21301:1518-2294(+)